MHDKEEVQEDGDWGGGDDGDGNGGDGDCGCGDYGDSNGGDGDCGGDDDDEI